MKKILIFLITIGFLFACDDELEIEPQQSISDQSVFADPQAAVGVLIGTYNLLQDIHAFGSQPQVIADYQSDNVNFVGSFTTLQDINTFSVTAENGTITEIWRDNYEPIIATNALIENLPNVEGLDESERNQYIGEARFIRALCYFNLVNLFAQPYQFEDGSNLGVPIVLDPFVGEVILYDRATLNEVHERIAIDLDSARILLPPVTEQGRASSVAATALLARLRLYREEWQAAADLAGEVLSSEEYSLASDYSFYNTVSPEIIFSIENIEIDFENQSDEEAGSGSWDSYYEPNNQGGRGDAPFSQDLKNAFLAEPGDLRFDLQERGTTFSGDSADFTTKYDDGALNTSDPAIIRYSEMVLTRAEALAELNGINQESIDLVNRIRTRAGLSEWTTGTFTSAEAFLEAIATERRKELAFEGHRRMDLLRRGKPLRTAESVPATAAATRAGIGVEAGDPLAIFPIPVREVELNPGLVQNPGY